MSRNEILPHKEELTRSLQKSMPLSRIMIRRAIKTVRAEASLQGRTGGRSSGAHSAAGHTEEHRLFWDGPTRLLKGREGSHCRTYVHTAIDIRLKITSGGSRWSTMRAVGRRSDSAAGDARRATLSTTWRVWTVSWLFKTIQIQVKRRCFGLTRHLRIRARISCVFQLLRDYQKDTDNLIDKIFEDVQEQSSLTITNELRSLSEKNNHESDSIDDLKKDSGKRR